MALNNSRSMTNFGQVAHKLARNPLGIIALFIVLIYGIACLTLGFSRNLPQNVILYFVLFITVYPFIVLFVFYRLVTKHHTKLYAPEDFPRPEDFLQCMYGDQARALTRIESSTQNPEPPLSFSINLGETS